MTTASTEISELPSPEGLGFKDAIVWRRWNSAAPSRSRAVTICVVLALAIPLHVFVFVAADNPWSLLAVPLNPLAIYVYLWGWGHVSAYWLAVSVLIAVAGTYLPFHLM